jgi:hypothetical protein
MTGAIGPDVVEAKVMAVEIGPTLAYAIGRFTYFTFAAFSLWLVATIW